MSFTSIIDSLKGILDSVMGAAGSAMDGVGGLLEKTHLVEQISNVDIVALGSNPWFMIPFVGFVGYMIYKQAFRDLTIICLLIGVWYVSGTEYMQTLVVGDEVQLNKVLPVLFGGAAVLGVIIYLLLGRSK